MGGGADVPVNDDEALLVIARLENEIAGFKFENENLHRFLKVDIGGISTILLQ